MRRVISSTLILTLLACNSEPPQHASETEDTAKTSNYSKLEGLFEDLSLDTFRVFSDWNPEDPRYAFKGKAMDSVQVSLLPFETRYGFQWNQDFGAWYKFPLDESKVALIARTPGEYVSSALTLFVFDLKIDSVICTIRLADSFGDAGEVYIYDSWLFKDKDKNLGILSYHYNEYDHSAGDVENDTIVEKWNYYYLFRFANNRLDTLSKDSAEIVKRFPSIDRTIRSTYWK